jgi:hypothetical protein
MRAGTALFEVSNQDLGPIVSTTTRHPPPPSPGTAVRRTASQDAVEQRQSDGTPRRPNGSGVRRRRAEEPIRFARMKLFDGAGSRIAVAHRSRIGIIRLGDFI